MSESTIDLNQPIETEKYLPVRANNATIPVTIKQILEADPSDDQPNSKIIDFVERKEVSIVGMVLNSTKSSYSTMYEIDDGTGSYMVQVIHPESSMNEENSITAIESFENGQYVYIVGRLSTTAQEDQADPMPVISAYSIRLCKDVNQIPFHFLQSLYVHLITLTNNKNKIIADSSQNKITDYLEFDDKKSKKKSKDYDDDSGNEKIDSSPINLNEIPVKVKQQSKIDIVKKSVLRFLSNTTPDKGIEIKKIFNQFSHVFSIDDIQTAIDSLSYNGEIVSTGLEENYFIV